MEGTFFYFISLKLPIETLSPRNTKNLNNPLQWTRWSNAESNAVAGKSVENMYSIHKYHADYDAHLRSIAEAEEMARVILHSRWMKNIGSNKTLLVHMLRYQQQCAISTLFACKQCRLHYFYRIAIHLKAMIYGWKWLWMRTTETEYARRVKIRGEKCLPFIGKNGSSANAMLRTKRTSRQPLVCFRHIVYGISFHLNLQFFAF